MKTTDLTIQSSGPGALVDAIEAWADARTDATSARRADLIRDKRRAVRGFFEWVQKPIHEVTALDVKAWQAELESRGLAHSTIYGMISRVSSFYRWAMSDPLLAERITHNPTKLARPKAPRPYQSESCKSLDDSEAKALLDVVKGKARFDVIGKRDLAMLLLFYTTGMRRAEVCSLRWGDIKLNGRLTITARRKGGDYLTEEIESEAVLDALVNYLEASGRWGRMQASDPLWTRHDSAGEPGEPLTSHAVASNFKRYARKVGIEGFHLHMLRHTSARLVADLAGDIGEVQTFLGHRNRAVTRIYVRKVAVKKDRHSNGILDRLGV